MAERLIELRDISKSYGHVYALGGVNLSVDRGSVALDLSPLSTDDASQTDPAGLFCMDQVIAGCFGP